MKAAADVSFQPMAKWRKRLSINLNHVKGQKRPKREEKINGFANERTRTGMKERKCVVALQWSFLGSDWESEVDADVDTSSRTISITFYERIAVYCVCVWLIQKSAGGGREIVAEKKEKKVIKKVPFFKRQKSVRT